MTASDILAVLNRLESLGPIRRHNVKRAALTEARDRLIALHARGHSWRAIARELSAAGEKVSADLLRAVCGGKRQRGAAKRPRATSTSMSAPTIRQALQQATPRRAGAATNTRFGARGLKP